MMSILLYKMTTLMYECESAPRICKAAASGGVKILIPSLEGPKELNVIKKES